MPVKAKPVLEFSDFPIRISRNDKYNWSYSPVFSEKYKLFSPSLNATEYKWYMEVISTFKNVCDANGIVYMLYGGSVFGAYRHHGFVPWDEDFDVLVNASQRQTLNKVLNSVPGYGLVTNNHFQWKFYSKVLGIPSNSWKWPFVDIFFFDYNETHVYDVTLKVPGYFYPRSVLLPIRQGIFETLIMPVPNDMDSYIKTIHDCESNHWDYRKEKGLRTTSIPCKILYSVYAFVFRFRIGYDDFEELRLNNKTLYLVRTPSSLVKARKQSVN